MISPFAFWHHNFVRMERSDWQLRQNTHKDRCSYAFENSLFCDVEFSVVNCDGNEVTVQANKYPLAVCSPVFEAMFYGKLAETKSPIHIPDCTKEGLQEILRYAHSEEAKLTGSNVVEVLYLAKKYMMPALEDKCEHYIRNDIGSEEVLTILAQVRCTLGDEDLENHLWKFVDTNTERVILSKPFLVTSRELLYQVLERDTLVVNALNLFKAVDKWATKRIEENEELVCNGETKRAVLGKDMIRLIPFNGMKQQEFVEIVLPSKILEMAEVTELFSVFSGIAPTTRMFRPSKSSRSDALLISGYRFQQYPPVRHSMNRRNDVSSESLRFKVNNVVNLVGVRLFGSQGESYNVDLTLNRKLKPVINASRHVEHEDNSHHQLLSKKSSWYRTEIEKIDYLYNGFTITLDKPVKLEADVVYIIEAKISGADDWASLLVDHWCGRNGKRTVFAGDEVEITFIGPSSISRNDSRPSCTTDISGQFPSLILQLV